MRFQVLDRRGWHPVVAIVGPPDEVDILVKRLNDFQDERDRYFEPKPKPYDDEPFEPIDIKARRKAKAEKAKAKADKEARKAIKDYWNSKDKISESELLDDETSDPFVEEVNDHV